MNKMYDFSILRTLRKREKLSIQAVAERSGVSVSVISKLERNQSMAELETLYKLSRVFNLNASDILAFAETRSAHRAEATEHESDGFVFKEIQYSNSRCLYGRAKAGSKVSRPKVHQDDYEVCWVLKGRLNFYLPNEVQELKEGESLQFDALLEHTYEALEDSEIIILHIKKGKRF